MRTPKMPTVLAKWEWIDPTLARKIMNEQPALWKHRGHSEQFKNNRALKPRTIEELCQQVKLGLWQINGDTIVFTDDGRLLDGQHRLMMVAQMGIGQWFLVMRGAEADVLPLIDVNQGRTPSEALGMTGLQSTKRLAAALRVVHAYKVNPKIAALCGGNFGKDMAGKNRIQQVLELANMYPDMCGIVEISTSHRVMILQTAIADACHYLFREKDPELADIFMDILSTGQGLRAGDPIYTLREKLINNRLSKSESHRWNRGYAMMLAIYAWNAMREGRSISRFSPKLDGSLPAIM